MKIKQGLKFAYLNLKGLLLNKAYPLNVMFSVTDRCTNRCLYCNIPARGKKELDLKTIKRIIDEMNEEGTVRLGIWGGEPLVRDDIGEIINYAKSKGMFVSMDTNAALLIRKYEEVKNTDVFIISFDGPKDIHDKLRGQGSYEKVTEGLKFLKDKNKKAFTITVLNKYNVNHIDYIVRKARELNFAATFQVLHHNPRLASKASKELMPSKEEYIKAAKKIIHYKKLGYPIVSSFQYLNLLLKWENFDFSKILKTDKTNRKFIKCFAGKFYCNIDTDGSVFPCSVLIDEMPFKNAADDGFKEAFEFSKKHNCVACNASCFTEYNFMHIFNFKVIYNWLKYTRS